MSNWGSHLRQASGDNEIIRSLGRDILVHPRARNGSRLSPIYWDLMLVAISPKLTTMSKEYRSDLTSKYQLFSRYKLW